MHSTPKNLFSCFIALTAFLCAVPALANSPLSEPATGTYVTDNGWGELLISRGNDGQHFTIEVVGTNYHLCNLEGDVTGFKGRTRTDDGNDLCEIEFVPTAHGIEVKSLGEDDIASGCRSYCGARAYFEGEYKAILPICNPGQVNSHIGMISALARADELAYAHEHIVPVLDKCLGTLRKSTEQDLRAALALAYYHAGQPENCRGALEVYQDWLAKTDAEIREEKSYAPSEADEALAQSKKLRNVLDLCKSK
jgi:hypothetical protein